MNENLSSLSQPQNATTTLENKKPARPVASCLRDPAKNSGGRTCPPQRVCFPDEENKLITGYMEPASPWEDAACSGPEELISLYKASCEKHCTEPLSAVVSQIQAMDFNLERNECLSLKGEAMTPIQFEPLEEILKRIQFKNIDVEATTLNDESAVALFDMLEYYESANYLNISSNKDIGSRGWHACSRMIKKTQCLERLDVKNVTLNEQHMPILGRALRITTHLQILKLENCWLSGRPIIILAAALRLNTGIKELYLADNDLGVTDAIQLASLLRSNYSLQLLDVSNNNIQDAGVGHISDGLIDQVPTATGGGLGILVLWNNHLTRNCSKHFARALASSKTLGMLNIGRNVLTNEVLHMIKDSLQQNRTLIRLGMQSTHITCEGAIALAECIADHPVIQRIDLRDNHLEVAGLLALTLSMKVNISVTQMDIDDTPKKPLSNADAEQYRVLVAEIRSYCTRNEQAPQEDLDTINQEQGTPERKVRLKSISSRKISLTCETLLRSAIPPEASGQFLTEPKRSGGRLRSPAPSPIPSPVSSPLPSPSRTRFSVMKVTETAHLTPTSSSCPSPSRNFFPSPSNSRFHVSRVEPEHCPATITSPSGNNVTVGFSFDVKSVAMSPSTASGVNNNSITTPIPEISVKDASTSLQSSSQDISVTVKHGAVIENKTEENSEDPDSEVRRIMNNDCSDATTDSERITEKVNQKSNSFLEDNAPLWCTSNYTKDIQQGNGKIDVPASTSAQRMRKISVIAPETQHSEGKIPTSLEKLIGLFNPGMFFNKPQQQYKSSTAAPEYSDTKGSIFSLERNRDLQRKCVASGTMTDDIQKDVSSVICPLPNNLNNNNNSDTTATSLISLNVTIDDSPCTLSAHRKEDENFNVHQTRYEGANKSTEDVDSEELLVDLTSKLSIDSVVMQSMEPDAPFVTTE